MIEVVISSVISAAALLALVVMSRKADRRFQHMDRLPMQWSLGGEVTWTAPRRIALSVIPGVAICILLAAVLSTAFLKPHPGQEGLEVPVVLILALSMIGVHALHIWLVGKVTGSQN
ncbi:hypothetical protein [Novosphingobium sp. JCM 18896]|uniref:hypothetical protein n=1 Tax=Novosphingobium sp. JCM 18896 TaxID=2989731 RepID=UPI002222D752|nr:hypothetical protein [Novosphingobium sp. JCM 18896]MCW1431615.1 hypothetical protein [Novosphingobium sp. JCM 18896]